MKRIKHDKVTIKELKRLDKRREAAGLERVCKPRLRKPVEVMREAPPMIRSTNPFDVLRAHTMHGLSLIRRR